MWWGENNKNLTETFFFLVFNANILSCNGSKGIYIALFLLQKHCNINWSVPMTCGKQIRLKSTRNPSWKSLCRCGKQFSTEKSPITREKHRIWPNVPVLRSSATNWRIKSTQLDAFAQLRAGETCQFCKRKTWSFFVKTSKNQKLFGRTNKEVPILS